MRIWVKPDQLTKLGLTVTDLTNAVQQQSAVNPAGQIGAEPAPKGQQFTYAVRAPGRLVNAEDFGNIIVRQNPDGSTVRLKDVSRIELGSLVYQQIGRYNGKPAVIIAVYQAPGSNALAVAKQVKAQMEELKIRFSQGLEYVVSMDTTLPITEGMKEIMTTLLGSDCPGHHCGVSVSAGLARNSYSPVGRPGLTDRNIRYFPDARFLDQHTSLCSA